MASIGSIIQSSGVAGVLNEEEVKYILKLRRSKVLVKITKGEADGITRNGGVAIFCGDGDIDAIPFHQETISSRPHKVALFGGILVFHKDYPGYNLALANGLVENALNGMGAKATRTIFLYPHYPCGMATKFNLNIEQVIALSSEVHHQFSSDTRFIGEKIHSFFHFKKISRKTGKEKQEVYLFYPELL